MPPVSNDAKAEYFYSKLPPLIGFKKEKANLRNQGEEEMWAYRFADITALSNSLIRIAGNNLPWHNYHLSIKAHF